MHYTPTCTPATPCHRWRHCDYCARLRQAKIAEIAASRCRSTTPTYAVITGLNPKTAVLARRFRAGTGGIWTLEIGSRMAGLHANLLLDTPATITADEIAAQLNLQSSAVWAQAIPRTDLRNVAAYISKRSTMPTHRDYDGRIYGSWGTWRGAAQIAREQVIAPALSAAAHQSQLSALGLTSPADARTLQAELNEPSTPPKTKADYKAIADRHLAALRALVDK